MRENVDEVIRKLVDSQENYIVGDLISAILKDNANCDMNVVESSKVIAVDSQTKQHQRENSHANAEYDCHLWMGQEQADANGQFFEFLRKSGSKQRCSADTDEEENEPQA